MIPWGLQMDQETIKWFASLGVGGILAWGMFYVHRKDTKEWLSICAAQRDDWKQKAELLLQVVQQNSSTIAVNTAATEHNTAMLGAMKVEIVDAFARAGVINRRHLDGPDDPPAYERRGRA